MRVAPRDRKARRQAHQIRSREGARAARRGDRPARQALPPARRAEISDADYDALRQRNEAIEARFPELVRADSPVAAGRRRAGRAASPRSPMRGRCCRSTTPSTDEDVADFVARDAPLPQPADDHDEVELVAEPKIDGLSITLRYENGRFVQGATRGDGTGRGRHRQPAHHRATSRSTLKGSDARRDRGARRGLYDATTTSRSSTRRARRTASRCSPTRATPPPARCASSIRAITARRPLHFFAYAWGEATAKPPRRPIGSSSSG